jgi:hypothetical protein
MQSPAWLESFSLSLTLFYILGQLFSDSASENSEPLSSLASVLKKLIHTSGSGCDVYVLIAVVDKS